MDADQKSEKKLNHTHYNPLNKCKLNTVADVVDNTFLLL